MKKFNEQLDNLEEDLDELLIKSEKILGYKSENLNLTIFLGEKHNN